MLVALTNDTCIKYYMAPQAYKVVNTYAHEISGWKFLSRLLHARAPHIEGMSGGIQSNLSTLAFNNREQTEDIHTITIRLQQ